MDYGEDFMIADTIDELVTDMNKLTGEDLLDVTHIKQQIEARDREMNNKFTKDLQITALRGARHYLGDKLIRVAKPHKILDPKHGPLIGVRLNILSRKTLGGLQINLSGQVLNSEEKPISGLYAAGEVTGFGGIHGYRSLEGTFLGGLPLYWTCRRTGNCSRKITLHCRERIIDLFSALLCRQFMNKTCESYACVPFIS